MYVSIPITGIKVADANIDFLAMCPTGIRLIGAYKFVGSDGAVAACNIELHIDTKGDGNTAGAGHIRLQANGRAIRVGDALDTRNSLILYYLAVGETVVT